MMTAKDPIERLLNEDVDAQVREELDTIHEFHRKEDFEWVMSDVKGRRFVWGLLEEAGIYHSSFDGTTEGTIFNEGTRALGLKILSLINEVNPGVYTQMIKEKQDYDRHVLDIQRNGRDA